METEFRWTAYGFRKDGTIGPATSDMPVLEALLVPQTDDEELQFVWSDQTTGPAQRPGRVRQVK